MGIIIVFLTFLVPFVIYHFYFAFTEENGTAVHSHSDPAAPPVYVVNDTRKRLRNTPFVPDLAFSHTTPYHHFNHSPLFHSERRGDGEIHGKPTGHTF